MLTKTIFTICVFTFILKFYLAFSLETSLKHFLDQPEHNECQTVSVKKMNDENLCNEFFKIYNPESKRPINKTECTAFWKWANCTEKVLFNTTECKKFERQLQEVFVKFTKECKTQVCDLSKFKSNSSLSIVLNWGVVVVMVTFFSCKHIFSML